MAFGNILFGGVIGAGVDMSSGAAYDYPATLSIPMSCSPKTEAIAGVKEREGKFRLGIKVENLTTAMAAAAGQASTDGVLVTQVDESGVGKTLGLKVGQILCEINGKHIVNLDGLADDIAKVQEGDIEFVVLEAGKQFKIGKRNGAL